MKRYALLFSLPVVALLGCGEESDTAGNGAPNAAVGAVEGATGAALQQTVGMYEVYEGIFKPVDGPPTATLEHFDKIRQSMTYDEVIRVVGSEPDVIRDEEVMPTMYLRREARWINGDGTELYVVFANLRVQSKHQSGLE